MAVTGDQVVTEVRRFLGDPYVYGAAGPNSFDCSGLVQYSLGQLGIKAPRTSEAQWHWTQHISRDQLQPGDLIFEQWPGDSSAPGHVVIYAGSGQVLEAPHTGLNVRQRSWSPGETTIVGYGRPPGVGGARGGSRADQGGGTAGGSPGGLGGLLAIPDTITGAFDTAQQLAHGALWLINPENQTRIIAGMFGFVFLIAAIVFLSGAA